MASDSDDLYSLLGLTADCTKADIVKAYKKKALQWHPDKNPAPEAGLFCCCELSFVFSQPSFYFLFLLFLRCNVCSHFQSI